MAEYSTHIPFQSNYNYQPLELSQTTSSRKIGKKNHSKISTRKSSADSTDLKVKFKTEICKYYLLNSECPFSELCSFAHGEQQLRNKDFLPIKYKTKECSKFSFEGYCPYGQRCQFIHLQGNNNKKYERLVETIKNDAEVFYQFFGHIQAKKPRRLSFFEQMESLEEIEQKAEEQSAMYSLAGQVLSIRSRHNSL